MKLIVFCSLCVGSESGDLRELKPVIGKGELEGVLPKIVVLEAGVGVLRGLSQCLEK